MPRTPGGLFRVHHDRSARDAPLQLAVGEPNQIAQVDPTKSRPARNATLTFSSRLGPVKRACLVIGAVVRPEEAKSRVRGSRSPPICFENRSRTACLPERTTGFEPATAPLRVALKVASLLVPVWRCFSSTVAMGILGWSVLPSISKVIAKLRETEKLQPSHTVEPRNVQSR
jgi:hypothetical protein